MSNRPKQKWIENDRQREREIVERVLLGDEEAFAEIYQALFRRVYAFLLKRVGERAEAEDLTQETFVQLFRSLRSFAGRSSLSTWTFGIASNVLSRHYRSCSRWMVGGSRAVPFEETAVEAPIERRVDAARAIDRCGEVLERSRRPAHRRIFHLRYAENLPIRAIAKRVDKSSDAVKVSLRRSRAALADGVPELEGVLESLPESA
jgi:RNA polymerase sigma-70 factor (ECF subfamily)